MHWRVVARLDEVPPGCVRRVRAAGCDVALVNLGGELHAIDNLCTHAYALLTDGWLEGDELECPLHGGRFAVRTGKAGGGIVTEDVACYGVRVENGEILLALPPDST